LLKTHLPIKGAHALGVALAGSGGPVGGPWNRVGLGQRCWAWGYGIDQLVEGGVGLGIA
jgi:hypothetical protein